MNAEILAEVKLVIAEMKGIPEPGDGTSLVLSGLLDSIDVEELAWELERRFAVFVPPREIALENFRTPLAVAAMVERLIASPCREDDPPPRTTG